MIALIKFNWGADLDTVKSLSKKQVIEKNKQDLNKGRK